MVRVAPSGGGAGRRRGGGGLSTRDELLRPACELAWAVARQGAEARPPIPPPRELVPLLKMARLPSRALAVIQRVLERDEAFRRRVAAVPVGEEELGRAGWLFLHRPEGWEAELAEIVADEEAAAAEEQAAREAQDLARRLAGAEEARRRAEARAAAAEERAAAADARAASERRAREAAEARAAAAEARAAAAEARAAAAERAADTRAGAAAGEGTAAAESRAGTGRPGREAADTGGGAAGQAPAAAEAGAAGPQGVASAGEVPVGPGHARLLGPDEGPSPSAASDAGGVAVDLAAVGAAIAEAAAAARRLAETLAAAAAALGRPPGMATGNAEEGTAPPPPPGGARRPEAHGATPATPEDSGRAGAPTGGRATGPVVPRHRTPAPLPPGILETSREAAEHLVRLPGARLLVDGYNATLTDPQWKDLPIAEQRQRLVDALRELAARTGVDVEVVFDGAEEAGLHPLPTGARQGVRVVFSDPGEDADDLILRRAAAAGGTGPVVVASSDRRVRDGARRCGANVIGARQLMALLRARP